MNKMSGYVDFTKLKSVLSQVTRLKRGAEMLLCHDDFSRLNVILKYCHRGYKITMKFALGNSWSKDSCSVKYPVSDHSK